MPFRIGPLLMALLFAVCLTPAAAQEKTPPQKKSKKVWTNEDVGELRGPVNVVGSEAAAINRFEENTRPYVDDSEMVTRLRHDAERGDPEAQRTLGILYYFGRGFPQDSKEAVAWLTKAAEQNDSKAQLILGALYIKGEGVAQNFAEAAKWLRQAANKDEPLAQDLMARLYYHGQGMVQDYGEALFWFRKAAEQNLPNAQLELARMYYQALGTKKDVVTAYVWAALAADGGESDAREALDFIRLQLTGDQITDANRKIDQWKEKFRKQSSQ